LTDYDKGTTLNVAVIPRGTATNVVPEEAVAEVTCASWNLAKPNAFSPLCMLSSLSWMEPPSG